MSGAELLLEEELPPDVAELLDGVAPEAFLPGDAEPGAAALGAVTLGLAVLAPVVAPPVWAEVALTGRGALVLLALTFAVAGCA